ncbi:bifunctional adenosylcobinamide kinase/adenosylcobinamide-phosphate guanylyltransferase [Alicyclobacillus sp. SO9]|uniref:bifunctional adenosylcobinamide kinase/adenosylcobinamide-phosphate guanylyltransferase n=1 Tax=Alicyclobacillus sp. SO9 TaxID=2665646 RepID=UPI0018E81FB6|nr:bifunctional adenosylcobinamide kinase/adenosylcobinamide-phosphate guanylyltransferase [Alicyclobacillus sp. SO9]QQE79685.1 bifunctional adenosylcobinamide kinase/adenosylcobinamide-phosphate guanylyltransferase [Alicyclobacillus sp. SO9]
MPVTLIIGGARSGKSSFAERYVQRLSTTENRSVTYIATAQALDDEMAARIAQHQSRRPSHWMTIEEPLNVPPVLGERQSSIILIDCLSLLLNNWMFLGSQSRDEGDFCLDGTSRPGLVKASYGDGDAGVASFKQRTEDLVHALQEHPRQVVVVSNEVGEGIVPVDAMTRLYRDRLGVLNQSVAAVADVVYLMVAGIAVDVRKLGTPW